jgi:hypothetical protein
MHCFAPEIKDLRPSIPSDSFIPNSNEKRLFEILQTLYYLENQSFILLYFCRFFNFKYLNQNDNQPLRIESRSARLQPYPLPTK